MKNKKAVKIDSQDDDILSSHHNLRVTICNMVDTLENKMVIIWRNNVTWRETGDEKGMLIIFLSQNENKNSNSMVIF